MLSFRSIVKQRCGMLEYCGLRCSRFLFNAYGGFASLFVAGADEVIYSREGTIQGDPLAMFFYGVSLLPLIRKLKHSKNVVQSWYADDSAAIAKLKKL